MEILALRRGARKMARSLMAKHTDKDKDVEE
jgi:hypothetical protein